MTLATPLVESQFQLVINLKWINAQSQRIFIHLRALILVRLLIICPSSIDLVLHEKNGHIKQSFLIHGESQICFSQFELGKRSLSSCYSKRNGDEKKKSFVDLRNRKAGSIFQHQINQIFSCIFPFIFSQTRSVGRSVSERSVCW